MLRAATATTRRFAPRQLAVRALSSSSKELELLEALLKQAKEREAAAAAAEAAANASAGPRFQIQTFNAISPVGLKRFPDKQFMLTGSSGSVPSGVSEEPHAILLRSHKLQTPEVIAKVAASTAEVLGRPSTQAGVMP